MLISMLISSQMKPLLVLPKIKTYTSVITNHHEAYKRFKITLVLIRPDSSAVWDEATIMWLHFHGQTNKNLWKTVKRKQSFYIHFLNSLVGVNFPHITSSLQKQFHNIFLIFYTITHEQKTGNLLVSRQDWHISPTLFTAINLSSLEYCSLFCLQTFFTMWWFDRGLFCRRKWARVECGPDLDVDYFGGTLSLNDGNLEL